MKNMYKYVKAVLSCFQKDFFWLVGFCCQRQVWICFHVLHFSLLCLSLLKFKKKTQGTGLKGRGDLWDSAVICFSPGDGSEE